MALRRRLIERVAEGEVVDGAAVEHKWSLFLELMRWTEGGSCRHDAILRYFGDEAEALDGCGRCDECLTLRRAEAADPAATTLIARKALSGVARVSGRFGLQLAVKLIRGDADPRLEQAGLTSTPTFGNLREHSAAWLLSLLRRCVTAGWATFSGGDRPVLVLTEDGRAGHARRAAGSPPVASGRDRASDAAGVRLDAARRPTHGDERSRAGRDVGSQPSLVDADPIARDIFEALRQHRLVLAREEGLPPYVIASDRTLREVAELRPRTLADLRLAHGIGPHKLDRYGAGLLSVVARVLTARDAGSS